MDLDWINPDAALPQIQTLVIIAIGTQQNKIDDYLLAKVGSSGAFVVSAYPAYNCLYSEKSPHRAGNAYRVIAYAEFGLCDVDKIFEPLEAPKEGEEGYGLYKYLEEQAQ